ncbi:piggyBac transposable element-derived protein 4-like [Melanotaenia boesemani]|uniref:piggyBac transposable element-derived protein 4-like n=1 Tax=Melanotaenia boesemani TaxID=1250792 RepID=UPI001C03D1FC|nr:piggyBac transposable element-derived protein 4-like [Melanotaenia boesemani]
MSKHRSKSQYTAEEALELLVKDAGSTVSVYDSSSEEEDLLYPEKQDGSDLGYWPLSSESWVFSDEDEDESDEDHGDDNKDYMPSLPNVSGPSTPMHQTKTAPGISLPPQVTLESGPSALCSTTRQKRGCSALGTSSPAIKNLVKKRLISSENEVGDRWFNKEEKDIKPDPHRFIPAKTPGPTVDTTKPWSPISLFQLFFSTSVVTKIIENTNLNAAKRKQAGMKFKWEVFTVKEFYTFLAIILFTGLVSINHRSDYWSNEWPYNFSFPSEKMKRSRFETILWSLHLSNPKEDEENEKKKKAAEYDRLFKIKPLYTEMVNACKAHFHPYKNLSIHERMITTTTHISMNQYIKNKPTKWGYKLHVLVDSYTGYTWNFFVHTSKRESTTGHGFGYSAVMNLLPFSFLGSGYTLYTDNFYTSPTLFNDLSQQNFGCCGTIKRHHTGFPQTQTNDLPKRAERGDVRWIRSGKLLFVKWMDSREVAMCSTVHQAHSGQTVTRHVKVAGVWQNKSIPVPDCILDYSQNMGGVDLFDGQIGFHVCYKTIKWYKAFFCHFVDIAAINSYLLHKELFQFRQESNLIKPLTNKTFREQLVKEMLEFAESSSDILQPLFPNTCMPAFYDSEETRARKHCKRCLKAGIPRVKTAVYCRKCLVPLCLSSKKNCFQMWHDEK